MNQNQYTIEDFVCDETFQQYCAGTDKVATQFWSAFLMEYPEKKPQIAEAQKLLSVLNARQGNIAEQLLQLKDGMLRYENLQAQLNIAPAILPAKKKIPALLKLAAVIAGLGVFGTIAFFVLNKKQPDNNLVIVNSAALPRKTIVLADGSVVTLNQNTSITLADNFNQQSRELTLSGEAFFDVKTDARRPFIVHTKDMDIKVLGTVFNVKAYADSSSSTTALFRGKIEVLFHENAGKNVVLTPNQKLVISQSASDIPYKILPLQQDAASKKASEINWIRNRLEIENEPLVTIAGKLASWYGISIVFTDDEVKKYSYSGSFESENVVKALEALQLSYPFSFKVQHDTIVISR